MVSDPGVGQQLAKPIGGVGLGQKIPRLGACTRNTWQTESWGWTDRLRASIQLFEGVQHRPGVRLPDHAPRPECRSVARFGRIDRHAQRDSRFVGQREVPNREGILFARSAARFLPRKAYPAVGPSGTDSHAPWPRDGPNTAGEPTRAGRRARTRRSTTLGELALPPTVSRSLGHPGRRDPSFRERLLQSLDTRRADPRPVEVEGFEGLESRQRLD
jgi:hypothetical protein